MEKVKIGIIGAGGIAQVAHLRHYSQLGEVELTSICDVNEKKAGEVAREFRIKKVYTDYRKMLENEKLDGVSVCTPNWLHKKQTVDALEAGVNVLCEKPMALNAQEAEEMAKVAKRTGKILLVGYPFRFLGEAKMLKRFVEKGKLGEVYFAKAGWLRRKGAPGGEKNWFTDKKRAGGGPFIDLGVHILDLTLWFMGSPKFEELLGMAHREFSTWSVENFASCFIKFKNGSSLFLETSWISPLEEERRLYISLVGSKGGAELIGPFDKPKVKLFTEEEGYLTNLEPFLSGEERYDPFGEEIKHFVECIKGEEKPLIKPEEGVEVMKIIDAFYLSSEKEVNQ